MPTSKMLVELNCLLNQVESIECYLRTSAEDAELRPRDALYWMQLAMGRLALLQSRMNETINEVTHELR